MNKLLLNTKTILYHGSILDFYSSYEGSLIFLQKLKVQKVQVFCDFDFEGKYYCGLTLYEFKNNIFKSGLGRDQRTLLLSALHSVIESQAILGNISDEELWVDGVSSSGNLSADVLSFHNRIHQFVFTNVSHKNSLIISNKDDQVFEAHLVENQWHYNIARAIDSLQVDDNILRIFENIDFVVPTSNVCLDDFSKFDNMKYQKKILKQLLDEWPRIYDGRIGLGFKKIKSISTIVDNGWEHRMKIAGNNEYRIYYMHKDEKLYILGDYYKKTNGIPESVKDRISAAYKSI